MEQDFPDNQMVHIRTVLVLRLSEMVNTLYFDRQRTECPDWKKDYLDNDRQKIQDFLQEVVEKLAKEYYLNAKG